LTQSCRNHNHNNTVQKNTIQQQRHPDREANHQNNNDTDNNSNTSTPHNKTNITNVNYDKYKDNIDNNIHNSANTNANQNNNTSSKDKNHDDSERGWQEWCSDLTGLVAAQSRIF
jgi:hypothetical protein